MSAFLAQCQATHPVVARTGIAALLQPALSRGVGQRPDLVAVPAVGFRVAAATSLELAPVDVEGLGGLARARVAHPVVLERRNEDAARARVPRSARHTGRTPSGASPSPTHGVPARLPGPGAAA